MSDVLITYRKKSTQDIKEVKLYPIIDIATFEGALLYLNGKLPDSAESKVTISGVTKITMQFMDTSLDGDVIISTPEYTQIRNYEMGKLTRVTDVNTGAITEYPIIDICGGNLRYGDELVECQMCQTKFKNFGSLRSHTNRMHRLSITKDMELVKIGDRSGPRTQ